MKILINTISPTEIAEIRLQQEKDGVDPKDLFTGTYEVKGELLIPGEWKHVPDDFNTSAYPYFKEVGVVLAERTKKVLEENGLNQFAFGLKEGREMYSKPVEQIATDVLKYAPITAKPVDAEPVAGKVIK